jgi:hypothetical protein
MMRRIPAETRTYRDEGSLSQRIKPEADSGVPLRADRIDDRVCHSPCRPRLPLLLRQALFTNAPTPTEFGRIQPAAPLQSGLPASSGQSWLEPPNRGAVRPERLAMRCLGMRRGGSG